MGKRRAFILLLFFFTGMYAVINTIQQIGGEEGNANGEDIQGRWEVISQAGLQGILPLFVTALAVTLITIQKI